MIYINLEDLEYSYILNAKDLNNEIKGRKILRRLSPPLWLRSMYRCS